MSEMTTLPRTCEATGGGGNVEQRQCQVGGRLGDSGRLGLWRYRESAGRRSRRDGSLRFVRARRPELSGVPAERAPGRARLVHPGAARTNAATRGHLACDALAFLVSLAFDSLEDAAVGGPFDALAGSDVRRAGGGDAHAPGLRTDGEADDAQAAVGPSAEQARRAVVTPADEVVAVGDRLPSCMVGRIIVRRKDRRGTNFRQQSTCARQQRLGIDARRVARFGDDGVKVRYEVSQVQLIGHCRAISRGTHSQ